MYLEYESCHQIFNSLHSEGRQQKCIARSLIRFIRRENNINVFIIFIYWTTFKSNVNNLPVRSGIVLRTQWGQHVRDPRDMLWRRGFCGKTGHKYMVHSEPRTVISTANWALIDTGPNQGLSASNRVVGNNPNTSNIDSVMGVMKMGNIVPRVEIKLTSLAFQASLLPLHHVGSLMLSLYPRLPVYASPCLRLRGQCKLL